jgi:hypothetical protein
MGNYQKIDEFIYTVFIYAVNSTAVHAVLSRQIGHLAKFIQPSSEHTWPHMGTYSLLQDVMESSEIGQTSDLLRAHSAITRATKEFGACLDGLDSLD